MAMTMKTVGLDEVMNTLARLNKDAEKVAAESLYDCLLYTSPSPRDRG